MITGTWVSSFGNDTTMPFLFGMNVYAVQYTTLLRAVGLSTIGILMIVGWRRLTPDKEITVIEQTNEHLKKRRRNILNRWKRRGT